MKTTFEFPDSLFRQAKAYAAMQGISLKELFTQAITEKLIKSGNKPAEGPWMKFYGKGKDFAEDLERLDGIIESEFEEIDYEDWK